jgi:hypothetical protein
MPEPKLFDIMELVKVARDWRKTYGGIQVIEELIDDISDNYGGRVEREEGSLEWKDTKEKKESKTTFHGEDSLKELRITLSYYIPLNSSSFIDLVIISGTSGGTHIKTQDPSIIINAICSAVSSHDPDRGKWIKQTLESEKSKQ